MDRYQYRPVQVPVVGPNRFGDDAVRQDDFQLNLGAGLGISHFPYEPAFRREPNNVPDFERFFLYGLVGVPGKTPFPSATMAIMRGCKLAISAL